jgi:hypothetical protein
MLDVNIAVRAHSSANFLKFVAGPTQDGLTNQSGKQFVLTETCHHPSSLRDPIPFAVQAIACAPRLSYGMLDKARDAASAAAPAQATGRNGARLRPFVAI